MQKELSELIRQRSKFRWTLAFLAIAAQGFFLGGIAFYGEWFSSPLVEGGHVTLGILVAVFTIITMVALEWLYVWRTETYFDPIQKRLLEEGAADE